MTQLGRAGTLAIVACVAAACAALACGGRPASRPITIAPAIAWDAPTPWDRSGIDWTTPPPLATAAPFAPPITQQFTLGNGVRVVVIENHRVPLVTIRAVHGEAGSRGDDRQPGLAALTVESLAQGIALGTARVEQRIATDHATIEVLARSAQLPSSLALIATLSRAPKLAAPDVERVRGERVRELAQRNERARTIAAHVLDRVVFGAHPYANPAEGTATTVATITAADVRAFWARAYRPSALTLIVAGDVSAAAVRRHADAAFGTWRDSAQPPLPGPPPLPRYTPQLAVVDLPGAARSVLLIGTRADAAGVPGQLAADVANAIVGGGVGARLDRELHERLALTLGASASAWRGQWAGSWTLATTFATGKTLVGIQAALAVVARAREDISADELARAKTALLAATQQSFDTMAGTVRAFERVTAQRLADDWYATVAQRLAALGVDDVRAAAAAWQDLSIVVVGDATKLEAQLRGLGLPIVRYSRDATVVP